MRLKNLLLTVGLALTGLLAAIPRAKATTCPNAIAITALPALNQTVVCGTTNDQSATSIVQNCNGSTAYYGGLEALYTFTPTTTGTIEISYSGQSWTGIFVFSGCPSTTGTTVVACTTSSGTSKSLQVAVTSGITYYLMFDTWPSPASPCPGTFSIATCVTPTGVNATGITTTAATINWTAPTSAPSNGYQYEVRTSGAAGSGATGLVTGNTTAAGVTTASISSLTPGTIYYVYVRGNCGTASGTSAWTEAYAFITLCNPVTTIPWNDGIEGVATIGSGVTNLPTCWKRINGDWQTADAGFTSYNDPRTGTRYLVVPWSATNEWMMTPGFQLTAGTSYDFSFYWAGDTYSSWIGHVGVNNVQDSTGATILGAPFVANGTATSSTYQQVVRTFMPTTSGVYYFGIRVNESTGSPWYLGFDDFRVNVTPTCPQPVMGTTTAITANGATINWTPATSTNPSLGYQIEVRTTGQPGTPGAVWTGTAGPTATSVPVTGLTGTTVYNVYVRAICSAGDSSFWSSGSFTTGVDCAAATVITACGVSQSFSIPAGQGSWGGYLQVAGGGNAPYQTPGIEKLYTYTATMTGAYTLSVSATNSQWADYFFKPVTSGCNDTGWTFIDDVFSAPLTATFNLTAGTQYYILVDPESGATPAQTFQIICPPTCGQPTSPTVTATTTTGATLSWTQPTLGSPTSWQISYGTGITSPSAGTTVIANANPYTLSGLTTATNYTYYVRAICGPGDTSTWSAGFTFATACLPFAAPFYQGFASGSKPACWTNSNPSSNTSTTALWLFSGTPGYGTTANGRPTGTYAWVDASVPHNVVPTLTSPMIDLSTITNPILEFEWYKNNTDPTPIPQVNNNLKVEGNPGGTGWVTLFDDTSNAAAWRTVSMMLPPAFANTTAQFRFTVDKNLSNDFYDDVLLDSVRVIQCTLPTLALGNDTTLCGTGATLTLNAGIGTKYTWSTGDTSQSIIVTQPGSYSVAVINGSAACSARDTINVTTGVLPVVNLGPDTNVCGNVLSFQLNAGNPLSIYSWSSPAGDLSMFSTQTIDLGPIINAGNLNNSGSSTNTAPVIVAVTNPTGCTGYDTVNVSVVFTARVSDFTIAGTDPTFTFTPVLDSFATMYNWTFGDGGTASATSATPPVSHTYNTNGTYTVTLVVGNQCGMTDTVTKTRQVTNDVKDVTADGTTITLYPNPTAADAVLTVDGSAKLRGYQVLNAAGAVVAERTLESGMTRTTLNTAAFAPGIYTLRIQLDKGVVVRKLEVIK